ncbi:hypothetical protein DFJ74DRAFT_657192 [Hyaloraphidium curvatum]|nr:hypothetical protein DFJ74DRAFT_657192 [Hyaloraphidium curvatum]
MLNVPGSTSTNTGLSPSCSIGATDVDQHTAGTSTASPLSNFCSLEGSISAHSISKFAEEPELTMTACGAPTAAANSRSAASTLTPMVSRPLSSTSVMASSSSAPKALAASGKRGAEEVAEVRSAPQREAHSAATAARQGAASSAGTSGMVERAIRRARKSSS